MRSHWVYLCALCIVFVVGCGTSPFSGISIPTPSPTPTPPAPIPTPNGPPSAGSSSMGFTVFPASSNAAFYDAHIGNTTYGTACTATSGQLVDCYMEAEELDMFFNGITLQYNIPPQMCSYYLFDPYYYFRYQSGTGPAFVQVDTDKTGAVGWDTNSDGTVDLPVVTCPYNYSTLTPPGPNCCLGTYAQTVRQWDSTNNTYTIVSSTNNNAWGGKAGNCLSGPAMDTQPIDSLTGYPRALIYSVQQSGISGTYAVASPISKHYYSNVFVANFFDPALTGGLTPTPLQSVNPYYLFQCLDKAQEIVAEIRVIIRAWNVESDFKNRVSSPTNYHHTGNESAPFNPYPLNDYNNWLDFKNTFPDYPNLAE